jgi:thioredoxin reductase
MHKDVIIIGGGSTGLYMAKLLEEEQIPYLIIENFHNVGGQCKNLYPNKYMYDVAGLSPITGEDFTNLLLSCINKNNIILNEEFLSYTYENSLIKITTNKNTYMCKKLIISNGIGVSVFNKPIIENLEKYENKQIFYFPEKPLINKNILIFGGGDSALDAVEMLYKNNNVTLIHRRNTFTSQEGKNSLLQHIKTYMPYSLVSLNGNDYDLTSVTIKNNELLTLPCDFVFFCYGYNQSFIPDKIIVNPSTMETNHKNVFAIGGIATYHNKRNLITTHMYECRLLLSSL